MSPRNPDRTEESAAPPRRLTRRRFLRGAAWGAASAAGGGTLLSLYGERHYPTVYPVTVRIPGLPPGLAGLRLCQLSDLHRHPLVPEAFLRRAAAAAAALAPDVVVLTGDYVSSSARYAASCADALAALRAPLGVYGVLGNHDYTTGDVGFVRRELERGGVQMLVNRSVRLSHGGADWWLCGLDDAQRGAPSLDETLACVPPGAFHTLLCHQPDVADRAAERGVPLQLSGHSHGGQVRVPGCRPFVSPPLGRKYPSGLRRVRGGPTQVYTNVGLGVIILPLRINCPPEITLMTLVPGL